MPAPVHGLPLLDESPEARAALAGVEVLYTDLDGTLLGPGGTLLADADGRPSAATAQAIVRLNAAGLPVVLSSGRNRVQLTEVARVCGWSGFIAELGCVLVRDRGGQQEYYLGDWPDGTLPDGVTPYELIERAGVLDALVRAFPGRIENHTPWHLNREATHVLRGELDLEAATVVLEGIGLPVRVVDNGIIRPPSTTLVGVERVHVYHLVPSGVTKSGAVLRDLTGRGLERRQACAIGDSETDVEMADECVMLVLVANALADERVRAAVRGRENVYVTRGARGEGWAELADAWLAARGGGRTGPP
ncbi:MAG: HAD hydrolase family protein [Coriobacteriia bacterium]|nr:HAD hydrolase family protein [Coriobacteriia bacterium]